MLFLINPSLANNVKDDAEYYMPTICESCMIFANELDAHIRRLPSKMPLDEAEAWLIDELEQLCERMLEYRLHKEKIGLARFSKQMTDTAKTIRNLKQRGVEVKMDVNDELLDRPSIESGKLKGHCEWILEHFEADIEHWFTNRRHQEPIRNFLCNGQLADKLDIGCSEQEIKGAKTRADEL